MARFDVAAQSKGPDSGEILDKHWLSLKRALKLVPSEAVEAKIDEISYILRVDGKFGSFELDGVSMKYSKWFWRYRYVQIDIGVPIARWRDRTDQEIAVFLAESLRQSVPLVKAVCDRAKLGCDEAILRKEIDQIAANYLSQWTGKH